MERLGYVSSMSVRIDIYVNGKIMHINDECRLSDLLLELGWKPTQVVTELNGDVVNRTSADSVRLHPGDRLELVVPVAGG